MLAPLPPRDGSDEEKKRHAADKKSQKENPELWGYMRQPNKEAAAAKASGRMPRISGG